MPTSIVFSSGHELQVTASIDEVAEEVHQSRGLSWFERFAGMRGDEVVAAERVAVRAEAIAYLRALPPV